MSLENQMTMEAFDYEQITVSSAVKSLTASKVTPTSGPPAKAAYLSVEGADLRYRYDGGAPVGGGAGHLLKDGNSIRLVGINNLVNFRGIRNATTDLTLTVTYER